MARTSTNGSANGHVNGHANGVANGSAKKTDRSQQDIEDFANSTTDHSRWRLLDETGRHTWQYMADDEAAKEWPQTTADKYHLGLPTVRLKCFHLVELFLGLTGHTGSPRSAFRENSSSSCRQRSCFLLEAPDAWW